MRWRCMRRRHAWSKRSDAALAKSGKQLEKEEKKQVKADSNALRKLLSKKTEKLEETDIAAIRSAKEQLDRSSEHVRSLG